MNQTDHREAINTSSELNITNASQDAQGLTEEGITPEIASIWASAAMANGVKAAREKCVSNGNTPAVCNGITVSETHSIVVNSSRKIVVINFDARASEKPLSNGVRVIGIVGAKVISVVYWRSDAVQIPAFTGSCGAEVRRVIGL